MPGTGFAIIQNMKFYVAARVDRKSEVRRIHKTLMDKKHKILSTWIDEGQIKPYDKYSNEAKARAIECINMVKDCDVFVLISDKTGAGMYTELGTAIVSSLSKKKPKIYIIGKYPHRSMFFFHPNVKYKKNIEEVLKDI